MNAGEFHAALRAMPLIAPADFVLDRRLLIISPHPDDETLGLGGLMAACCANGRAPHVVIVTDGAGSHPNSRAYPSDRLVALRKAEAAEATRLLGLPPGRLTHMDVPDTKAPTAGPAFEAAVAHLVTLAEATGIDTALVTWIRDPHCDHEAAALMARALRERIPALTLWFYPIWGLHLDGDEAIADPRPEGFRLDIAPWLAIKKRALAAYRSQMTPMIDDDPDGFHFTADKLAPFVQPVETVFKVPL